VTGLDERGVRFRSLRESIDTTTAGGRLVFHLFGALAQFEREIIRDRTLAGLAAARARGRVGGRPSKLSAEQRRQARRMYDARELTVAQIGEVLGVSRTAVYRALSQDGATSHRPAAAGRQVPKPPSPADVEAAGDVPGVAEPSTVEVKGRRRSSRPWFLVEADVKDPAGPVAVVSRYASERAAQAALVRARNKRPGEHGAVLEVRTGEQIGSRLEWDADLGRTVVRQGPPA
jgi:biotin operon repressor